MSPAFRHTAFGTRSLAGPRSGPGAPPGQRGKPATSAATAEESAQAFSVRLFGAGLASAELMTCFLGLELGLYDALRRTGAATAARVAEESGLDPRMVREWLEQQTCAGVLTVDTPEASPEARRFTLPLAHAEALLDADSPNWIAPLVVMPIGGMAAVLPQLVEAYRGRRGLPYAAYGEALRGGQAGLNRGVFEHHLPGWISRHLPDIDARLRVPGSSIADVACGSGLSTLALARMFPDAEVHGLDLFPLRERAGVWAGGAAAAWLARAAPRQPARTRAPGGQLRPPHQLHRDRPLQAQPAHGPASR
jgi:hypothetical protein